MSKRIKLTHPVIQSRFECEAAIREICELKTAYAMAEAEMNAAVTAAKKQFEATFGPINKRILEKSALVQSWAEANPSEFNGAKSLDLVHGQIGWRTGNPTLKTLSGWTWDRVLEKLQERRDEDFIRVKQEVNKEGILNAREEIGADGLKAIGVKVIQDEAFFIQPKLEQTETRIVAESDRKAA